MVKSLPARSEVTLEETWNLKDLFESEEAYQAAVIVLEKEVEAFVNQFKGNINDASSAEESLKGYAKIHEKFVPIGSYEPGQEGTYPTDSEAQMRSAKFGSVSANLSSKLSFVDSELLALPVEFISRPG